MPIAALSAPKISSFPYLLLPVPITDFREYLEEAIHFPDLITSIDADLDRHAKEKKELRLADQKFLFGGVSKPTLLFDSLVSVSLWIKGFSRIPAKSSSN